MKKLFVAAMALATIVSCSKDDVQVPELDSNTKSVAVKIENAGSTRADGEAGNTTAGINGMKAVVEASELHILFADKDGNVLENKTLVSEDVNAEHPEANDQYAYGTQPADALDGSYIFHNVPAAVTQIAIVRYEADDAPTAETLEAYEKMANDEALNLPREIDDIVLYSESTLTKTTECATVNGIQYFIYTAKVRVAPTFTRFEINNIECEDLGALNADGKEDTYGLDVLTLKSLVWGAGENVYSIAADELGVLDGVWKNEGGKNNIQAPSGVWSWNMLPDNVTVPSKANPLTLNMDVKAHDYAVAKTNLNLLVEGLQKDGTNVTSFDAENIYQLNLKFKEGNISGQEGICVNVEVEIATWTVNTVKPVFGQN